nr:hypothetical protein [Tanacetum cinerariifolium]
MMSESKSFEKHPTHKALYDSLMLLLIKDEDDMDKAAAISSTHLKRQHDDEDEDPSAGLNQGKKTKRKKNQEYESSNKSSISKDTSKGNTPPKTLKSNKSMHAKESVAEPTEEVIMDVADNTANIDVVNDVDQLQDDSVSKTNNEPKKNWFRESPRPHTHDTLTFDELMATPIDFFKFAKNHLKIDKLTKADLVGLVCKLLKGTCQSSIELEYNMEEYHKAVFDQLDWENPKGDRFPFDLSKPLPLKAHPGHLTVAT